jgi:hypothetical protein
MERNIFDDDDALLAALKEALSTARHPQEQLLVANAQDLFTYPTLDQELIKLVYDSLLESGQPSATREPGDTRMMVFESEALSMEVEISGDTIFGQIAPVGRRQVRVEAADGSSAEATTDELGCFSIRLDAGGPLRFRIGSEGSATVTEWTHERPSP